jgi:tetratricopeptide (TPR) repeat protein
VSDDEAIQALLAEAAAADDAATRAELLRQAALVYETDLGDADRAAMVLEAAIEADGTNVAAAEQLARLTGARPVAPEALDRNTPLDPLAVRPDVPADEERTRLLRHVDEYVAAFAWDHLLATLRALAALEVGSMRAKYLAAAGKVAEKKLGNVDQAVALFNEALDADAYELKTFERLYHLLAARRSWREAEANLHTMIGRIERTPELRQRRTMVALWRRLADVYRLGLGDLDAAARAYARCADLDPNDERYRRLISELTARGAG